jgi:hypothetical protein
MRCLHLIYPLAAALAFALPAPDAHAQVAVGVSITATIAPPPLPDYDQPPIPGSGYIWVPGYWAWGPDGYYWVPGTWALPPAVGLLWTPGWWGWGDGAYVWHAGYWGPHCGYYGGIDYGYGYTGDGYWGGYWNKSQFFYNRNVNNISSVNITNVYSRTVINNVNVTRVSFNGGAGGVVTRPTAEQLAFERERHDPPTAAQLQHVRAAETNRALLASANHGDPPVAATAPPNDFRHDVVAARAAAQASPASNAAARAANEAHPTTAPGRAATTGAMHAPGQAAVNAQPGAAGRVAANESARPNAVQLGHPAPAGVMHAPGGTAEHAPATHPEVSHPAVVAGRPAAPAPHPAAAPHPAPARQAHAAPARPAAPAPHPMAARPAAPAPHPAAAPHPAPARQAHAAPARPQQKHG